MTTRFVHLSFGLALGLAGCGTLVSHPASLRYTVSAVIQIDPDGSEIACFPEFLASIGNGNLISGECTGVPLTGVDTAQLKKERSFADGRAQTGALELIGVWTGKELKLDSPAKPATTLTLLIPPSRSTQEATLKTRDAYARLRAEDGSLRSRGIWVVEGAPRGDGLVVMVVAADGRTVDYLSREYGAHQVLGWFKPV